MAWNTARAGDGDELIHWRADGSEVTLGVSRLGRGPLALLLPALSSISTRHEMRALQETLAEHATTVAVDWPGFGDRPRPKVDWRPQLYRNVLADLARRFRPAATIAAGHGAGYALAAASSGVDLGRLCLLSPTWRGPFPTMMNGQRPWFRRLARAVDLPLVGEALYRLNVNGPVIRMMTRGHVYQDPNWLHGDRMIGKRAVTDAEGARYAAFRFVTGQLDPFADEADVLAAATRIAAPMLVIHAKAAPPKSGRTMRALAALPHVESVELPMGKLSFYEEFPDATALAIRPFLQAQEGT